MCLFLLQVKVTVQCADVQVKVTVQCAEVQVKVTVQCAEVRPLAALMLHLAPHPGRPLSSDLAPALVITLRPQLRDLAQ